MEMKMLAMLIATCLLAGAAQLQAGDTANSTSTQVKAGKQEKDEKSQDVLAKIDEALAKRQEEKKEAVSKGRTEIANAIQKIITDLNNMKAAHNNNDKDAFEAANKQRKADREALEELRKTEKPHNKNSKDSNSTSSAPFASHKA
jgi:hypothetical protein